MSTTAERWLTGAAAAVIVALTGAAFWLSYAHLHTVAADHGLKASPARAWAWPATLDLFIVSGELLMLRASLAWRTDWWAVALTVVGSGGSIALNIAGVTGTDPLDYVTAAVPPAAALLAFGALMRQVHDALSGAGTSSDLLFSRSREDRRDTDQAFPAITEEGEQVRDTRSLTEGHPVPLSAVRDSASLTEVPAGPLTVGSLGDLTNPDRLGGAVEKGVHSVETLAADRGTHSTRTPSDEVGQADATGSIRPADGKGVHSVHALDTAEGVVPTGASTVVDTPGAGDLRGAAKVITDGVSAADPTGGRVYPGPVPAGYTPARDRVHLDFLPLPDRPRAVVALSATTGADEPRTRSEAHPGYVPEKPVPAGYTDSDQDEPDELADVARVRFAGVLADGAVPSIRTLRAEYGIGQARAQRVQDALRAVPAAV
jgi:hypothetical protein